MEEQKLLIKKIIEGIQEKKGKKITTVDMTKIDSASAGHFIICEGTPPCKFRPLPTVSREYVRENINIKPFGYDGYQNSQWIVIDYGDILVHVFLPEYREYYKLEQLWNDAKLTDIPDLE